MLPVSNWELVLVLATFPQWQHLQPYRAARCGKSGLSYADGEAGAVVKPVALLDNGVEAPFVAADEIEPREIRRRGSPSDDFRPVGNNSPAKLDLDGGIVGKRQIACLVLVGRATRIENRLPPRKVENRAVEHLGAVEIVDNGAESPVDVERPGAAHVAVVFDVNVFAYFDNAFHVERTIVVEHGRTHVERIFQREPSVLLHDFQRSVGESGTDS